jgi:hypothetical protein
MLFGPHRVLARPARGADGTGHALLVALELRQRILYVEGKRVSWVVSDLVPRPAPICCPGLQAQHPPEKTPPHAAHTGTSAVSLAQISHASTLHPSVDWMRAARAEARNLLGVRWRRNTRQRVAEGWGPALSDRYR